jgi:hypothetical protein
MDGIKTMRRYLQGEAGQDGATKIFFVLTLGAAALSAGAGILAYRRAQGSPSQVAISETAPTSHARKAIQYFVVPLWLTAGIADWWCHRQARIERTTGLKETIIHLGMLAEAAIPVVVGLFFEINPLVLGGMIAAFFVHEATAMWDVRYAVTARVVTPLEQHVHSFLEMVPLMAIALISVLHASQLRALVGGQTSAFQPFRKKEQPLEAGYPLAALGTMFLFEVLPYLEEAIRDWRAAPGRLRP